MARIRQIKPEFFESEDVAALPMRARLTWIGLWLHCDNYGRAKDNLKLVKKNVWPLDAVSLADVEDDLSVLAEHGRIVRYEVDGRAYMAVVNWDLHQSIPRPGEPKHPAPPPEIPGVSRHDSDESVSCNEDALRVRGQGSGVKGQGRSLHSSDTQPPARCPKHQDSKTPPKCGNCKEARLNYEQWKSEQAEVKGTVSRELAAARADSTLVCHHGHDGGQHIRSDTGEALCAQCRAEQREVSA